MENIADLSNQDLSLTLKSLGLKSGPVTAGTRRVFEGLLRKYYKEQNGNNDETDLHIADQENQEQITNPISSKAENVSGEKSGGNEPCVYYSICRSRSACLSSDEDQMSPLVCTSLDQVLEELKSLKGARFKTFTSKNEAERFSLSGHDEEPNTSLNSSSQPSEPVIPFKTPTTQELTIFRRKVELGNLDSVKLAIYNNPKYLVSSEELPVILQVSSRYNAMHVAVKKNQLEICKMIVDILDDDVFWKSMKFSNGNEGRLFEARKTRMLDYYVNCPDKGATDTPLHIACKFGLTEIVGFLVSIPIVEKEKVNKSGEKPADVICNRLSAGHDTGKKRMIITKYLESSMYVPLLRAEDNSMDPVVGKPVNVGQRSRNQTVDSPVSPLNPKLLVRAYAGPMSPQHADEFFREWRSPKRKDFLNDFEKGKERFGRHLAISHKVPWAEYWSFLNCFVDLRSDSGLRHLEQYFIDELDNYLKNDINIYATPIRSKTLQSEPWNRNCDAIPSTKLSFEEEEEGLETDNVGDNFSKDEDYMKKNLFDTFNSKSPTDVKDKSSSAINNPLKCGEIENMMDSLSLENKSALDDNALHQLQQDEILSSESSCESDTERSHSGFDTDADNSLNLSNNVFADSPLVSSQNPTKNAKLISRDRSMRRRCEDMAKSSLFIKGPFPSKLDFDVYRALENVRIDRATYPHIYNWMQTVSAYSNEDKNRWPSPCSPRYQSKIRRPDLSWSL
eukprot:gene3429-3922_t